MPYRFSDHFYVTQLSSEITSSATTITVDTLSATFADDVRSGGEYPLRIGRGEAQERVLVTGIADEANNKLTVERGVEYGASSHSAGARVAHAMPAGTATRINAIGDALRIQEGGDTVEHLYLPEDGKMWQDSAQTTPVDTSALPQPLGALEDQSGNHVATQSTTANKPSVKEDAQGRLYIYFVPNEDFLETTVTTPTATKVSTIPGVGAFSAEVDRSIKGRTNVRIQSTTAGALVRSGTYSQDARGDWASALDQRGKDVADNVTSFKDYFRGEPLVDYDAHAQDTSSVTDMGNMFRNTSVSDLSPLSGWDTSSVTDMRRMFQNTSVSDPSTISGWDVANVTDFTSFLEGAPLDSAKTGDMLDGWTDGSPNTAADLQTGVTLGIQNADFSQMDTGGQDAVNALCSNQSWTINATNAPADCS